LTSLRLALEILLAGRDPRVPEIHSADRTEGCKSQQHAYRGAGPDLTSETVTAQQAAFFALSEGRSARRSI
jgi:hypothetical protein